MILFELFLGFLKVGCFSFGGAYAAIPLIKDVVTAYGWIDAEMLAYMIAVSESTPGPIMVNIATYIGYSQAGVLGALVATIAVVFPAFLIVILITKILSKAIDNIYIQAVLRGIKPCIIGIILETGLWMAINNLFKEGNTGLDIRALIITVILTAIYFGQNKIIKRRISPIMLICISAFLGAIGYSILV